MAARARAACGLLAGASAGACGLLVGDPHGRLQGDAGDVPVDSSVGPDGGVAESSVGAEGGGSNPLDGGVAPDGMTVCDAALDADPKNCGWCAHDCRGAACGAGSCEGEPVVAVSVTSMAVDGTVQELTRYPYTPMLAMIADGQGVYWSPQVAARIEGCSDVLCTGGVRQFSPVMGSGPTLLALDPNFVYAPTPVFPGVDRYAR